MPPPIFVLRMGAIPARCNCYTAQHSIVYSVNYKPILIVWHGVNRMCGMVLGCRCSVSISLFNIKCGWLDEWTLDEKLFWSRRFACATLGGIFKCSWPLITQTFTSLSILFLHALFSPGSDIQSYMSYNYIKIILMAIPENSYYVDPHVNDVWYLNFVYQPPQSFSLLYRLRVDRCKPFSHIFTYLSNYLTHSNISHIHHPIR